MTERITGAEVRMQAKLQHLYPVWMLDWLHRVADTLDTDAAELAALRGEAENWRAAKACLGHPLRANGNISLLTVMGTKVVAPDFPALLAKLDALAEAAKPKAERWRWYDTEVNAYSIATFPSADAARRGTDGIRRPDRWLVVRELRNPRGHVLLLPEGEPVPEGWT